MERIDAKPLNCLVTGATGFLGRHLVDRLLESGASVRAFARRSSDTRRLKDQGVALVIGDENDQAAVSRAVEDANMVFHLAAYLTAAAPFDADNPQELSEEERARFYGRYQAVNVDFTKTLLQACLAAGCDRFIFASSSSVYGPDVPIPTPENASLQPTSAYGRSKLLAEEAVRAYQNNGLQTTIVRPPVIYGSGDRYFTPLALRLSRLPLLPLVNGGRSLMDLVYVRDVANLMWRAALRPEAIGGIYNAGSGQPVTLNDLVQAFRQLTGRGPRILTVSPQAVQRTAWLSRPLLKAFFPGTEATLSPQGIAMMERDLHLSMEKAAAELDFRPNYNLEEGLKETLSIPD